MFKAKDSLNFRKVKSKSEISADNDVDGFLIESSEKEARRIIQSLKDSKKLVGIIGQDDAFNRRALETLKIDYLVSPEGKFKKDTLKQRDSGLNHVAAKIAKEKGAVIIVDMYDISNLSKKEKGERVARVIQNVKVCRKVGCKIKIASLAKTKKDVVDELGRKSFGASIGMSSSEVRDSVVF